MALRKILTEEDPILRKKSKPVTDFGKRTADLMDDLTDTMVKANGLGLASPQVGLLRRAVVIVRDEKIVELINPEIIASEGEETGLEGCLSVPGKSGYVCRPTKVTVKAQDRNGEWFELECEGMAARAACHELDHLDGILYIDKAEEVLDDSELYDEEDEEEEKDSGEV